MTSFLTPVGRQPRGLVKINGIILTGWLDFDVDNNNYYSADTFRLKLACGALPETMNTAWFCSQQDMYVELFIGIPQDANQFVPEDLTSWIYGQTDEIDFDPFENVMTLAGRDLTRVFIDTKTTQKWPNLTSSAIATQLAKSHGLTPVVTATTAQVGKYYEIDKVNLSDDRSEWDLLNYLAGVEGFVVYVRGQSLYFQPGPDPATATPYELIWTPSYQGSSPIANFERVNFKRALTVSRGIQVVVRSWNKKQAQWFTATYPTKAKSIQVGKSAVGSGAQIYSKSIANLSQEQVIQHAQSWYQQLVAHEMKFENMAMPGDNGLDTTSIIKLSGTGTAFDQTYYPDTINRAISFDGGYEMTIAAKNHSPDSETQTL